MSAWFTAAALATVVAAAVSALVAYLVARYQARSTALREMHERQSEVSVEVSKLLLESGKTAAASRRFAVAVIKIVSGPDDDKKGLVLFIPYNSRVTVGRDDDNDVVLSSSFVSRFHCGFVSDGADVYLEDYCSTNGVSLRGKEVEGGTSVKLDNGDIIKLCDYVMRFQTVHHSQVLSR
jgi:hypothetical protein